MTAGKNHSGKKQYKDMKTMNQIIEIQNNGPELISTNYWQSKHAQKGYVYLTVNAGCFRLLVPVNKQLSIDDMITGKIVLITRGPWPDMKKKDALELLFEDYTDSPYILQIASSQVDRMPEDSDQDRKGEKPRWMFAIYTEADGKIFEVPARYRRAKKLPYMKEWSEI